MFLSKKTVLCFSKHKLIFKTSIFSCSSPFLLDMSSDFFGYFFVYLCFFYVFIADLLRRLAVSSTINFFVSFRVHNLDEIVRSDRIIKSKCCSSVCCRSKILSIHIFGLSNISALSRFFKVFNTFDYIFLYIVLLT